MFGSIRLVLGCLVLVGTILIINKHSHDPKRYAIAIVITLVLTVASAFVPFENILLSFDSPEAAYQYFSLGNSGIKLVVEGKCSDLVVGSKNGTDELLIVPRSEQGWKVGLGTDTKLVANKIIRDMVVQVYRYKNTDDYYIVIADTTGGAVEILDIYGSAFASQRNYNAILGETFFTYYASIPNFNESYWFSIDGEIILIS